MANQKKGRKVGRNIKSGQNLAYKQENRHGKSHVRRMKKHIAKNGVNDKVAIAMLLKYSEGLGLNALNSAREFISQQKHEVA